MHRVEGTSNVYKSSDEEFFVIKRLVNLTNKVGKAVNGSSAASKGKQVVG